jgi:hypothetical protein
MFEHRMLWTLEQDMECAETRQMIEHVPEVLKGYGQKAVYIGASWGRQMCLPTLLKHGWKIAVVESYSHNAEWLSKQGLNVVHGNIMDCLDLLQKVDAVFGIHLLEHLDLADADILRSKMIERPLAVAMCPLGGTELDPPQYGNNREAHRHFVEMDHFVGWEINVLDRPGSLPNLLACARRQ